MTNKPWHEYLLDFLAGLFVKGQLEQAGAPPGAGFTTTLALPTFAPSNRQPPATQESRDLADCEPELVRRYLLLKHAFALRTGRSLFETCTWRSSSRQQDLYRVGRRGIPGERTVTKIDGVTKRSRHNFFPSQAIDVCVDSDPGPGKVAVWDRASYAPLGPLAAEFGLMWGGNWAMDDYPHLELPG